MRAQQARCLIGVIGGLLAVIAMGCGDGLEPTPIEACADDQEVIVSVSSNPTPVFAWTPACGMASLQVLPSNGNPTSGWALYTGSSGAPNPLRSRIRYGDAPPEALEPAPATELEPGTEYTITVYRWVGDSESGALIPHGAATFLR